MRIASETSAWVAEEGEVANDVGSLGAADDGLDVVDHLVHGHGHGGLVTEHHLSEAVTDKDEGDSRVFDKLGGCVVVSGNHGNFLPVPLHPLQVSNGYSHRWYLLMESEVPD